MPESSQNGSLVEQAVRRVRDYIRQNDLKVGDTLPGEAHFVTELGVSRAVMREAFGALAALRLIDVGNGRRARVGAMDGSAMAASLDHAFTTEQVSLTEIWDVRRTLELRTVALAAERRSAKDAKEIVDVAVAMDAARGDLDQLTAYDIRFHEMIARASDNGLFVQIIQSFEPLMKIVVPSAWRSRTTPAERQTVMDNHHAVAAAIARGNPTAAVKAMDRHFSSAIGSLFAIAEKGLTLRR